MIYKPIVLSLAALALAMLPAGAVYAVQYGDTLVGNAFVTGYDGWTDALVPPPQSAAYPNWGVLLTDSKCLSESSDGYFDRDDTPNPGDNGSGNCKSFNLVNTATTPENTVGNPAGYHLKANLSTWDNDGFGLVFGYVDESNYFRVAFRQQADGNLGYPVGVSVQKVVSGVVTQLATNTTAFIPAVNNTAFDVDVAVTGANWAVSVNGNPIPGVSGTETGSSLLTTGNLYGVHSWYQRIQDIATIPANVHCRGTEVHSVTVTDAANAVIRTHTFGAALPVAWKTLTMVNAAGSNGIGAGGTTAAGKMRGNFHQDFRNGTIVDDTNGYVNATAANADFIGPSVVIDDLDAATWGDYEVTVRLQCGDDDGMGLLVRALSDTTFYRINFCSQAMGTGVTRPPQGMSIQKSDGRSGGNPVWTELFRDNQTTPAFVYTPGTPFDVKAAIVGDTITVQVMQGATVVNYATVTDASSPILTGSVGFTNWGCGDANNGVVFSAYGGVAGHALLTAIVPEPASLVLLSLLALCLLALRHRD